MEEMKLLGLIVRNDLSWKANTEKVVAKAYKKLWMVKRLQRKGANLEDPISQVRSVLEFGAPVRNSSLTKDEAANIESRSHFYISSLGPVNLTATLLVNCNLLIFSIIVRTCGRTHGRTYKVVIPYNQ